MGEYDTVATKATKAQVGGVIGAVVAGLGALGVALQDDVVTQGEWVGVAVATLTVLGTVFGSVYAVTNQPK